ncbi:MAG TPA: hypothetical protein VF651_06310 [Gammaproteobacteria bacterium]
MDSLEKHYLNLLVEKHGWVLVGRSLMKALGYPSLESLRQAIHRGSVPVPLFPIENRKGMGALSTDVAKWMAGRKAIASIPEQQDNET